MIRFIGSLLFGMLVLGLGLGSIGCSGSDTSSGKGQQKPDTAGKEEELKRRTEQMREQKAKMGAGSGAAPGAGESQEGAKDSKAKDQDKPKGDNKEK